MVAGSSEAHLLGFRSYRQGRPTIFVPEGSNVRLSIGRVIRNKHFDSIATVHVAGFTTTSAAETIMTLARDQSFDDLEATLEDALLAGQVEVGDLRVVLERDQAERLGSGEPLVAALTETDVADEGVVVLVDGVEDDPLSLAKGAEHGALQRSRTQKHLGAILVAHDDADTRYRVVGLDDTLVHDWGA